MDDVLQKSAGIYEPRGRLDPAGFVRHVRFQTYPPPDDLRPFIEHGWSIRWDEGEATYLSAEVMHRPYVDAFVSSAESGIQGTFRGKRTYVAAGSGRILGVRFRPGAFHAVWTGRMADLQDQVMDLKAVFPSADTAFVERTLAGTDRNVIDALFDLVRGTNPSADPTIDLVNEIIAASEADEALRTVRAVAQGFGRSERWLQQTFREYLGIGLKWLLQRQMLLAAAARIRESVGPPDWADLAYELGYSSQQHFITDFRKVLGQTPVQYWRAPGGGA